MTHAEIKATWYDASPAEAFEAYDADDVSIAAVGAV